MTDLEGRLLGSQYHINSVIGRSGTGEVWRGTDAQGHPYAFKLISPQLTADNDTIQSIIAERPVLMSIDHPNVVPVRDIVVEGSKLSIVCDLVQGQSLNQYLAGQETLSSSEACYISAQAAHALSAIHTRNIIHRDLKPTNILLDQTAFPAVLKVADFGLAKLIDSSLRHSQTTALADASAYTAPEILSGIAATPQSDIYSLGIILYELLCGITPFDGLAGGSITQTRLAQSPGRPEGLDNRLWAIIDQMTAIDPVNRPNQASDIAVYLEQLIPLLNDRHALPKLTTPPPAVPSAHPYPSPAAPPPPAQASPIPQQPAQPGWPSASSPAAPAEFLTSPSGQRPPASSVTPMAYTTPSNYQGPLPQIRTKSKLPLILGIAVGVILVMIAVIIFLIMNPRNAAPNAAAPASPSQSAVPSSSQAPTKAPTPTKSPAPTTATPSSTLPPAVPWPPDGTAECADSKSVAVNSVTTCNFAMNVLDAYYSSDQASEISAYSPQTQTSYTMTCAVRAANLVVCTGGTNAEVYINR